MKALHSTRRLALLAAGALLAAAPHASAEEGRLEPLTFNPAEDTHPTTTPDGRWLVHVTMQDGAGDLRAARLVDGRARDSVPVAPGASDERAPAFSPDGQWLAWQSTAEDALGDVWIKPWHRGSPRNVSVPGMADSAPWWVERDGEVFLRHWREDPAGERQLVELDTRRWSTRVLSSDEALAALRLPAIPLLRDAEASVPLNAPGASSLLARLADDTNGDGLVDLRDNASLWRLTTAGWLQATPPIPGLSHPAPSGDGDLLAARLHGQSEIMRLATRWTFDGATDARALLADARDRWQRAPARPLDAVAAARNAALLDPDGEAGQQALLLAADILRATRRPEQALAHLADAPGAWAGARATERAWRMAVLAHESALRADPTGPAARASLEQARAALGLLVRAATGPVQANARLELATLHLQANAARDAMLVLDQPMEDDALDARRLVLRARGAAALGLPSDARRLLLEAMRAHPESLDETEAAAFEYLDKAQAGTETVDEAIVAIRESVAAAGTGPPGVLLAAARLREGRVFRDGGRPESARQAFRRAMEFTGEQPRLAAQAAFELAAMLAADGEYAESIAVYDGVEAGLRDRFFAGAPAFYNEAREGLVRESLAKGYYEARVRDYLLALATFADLAHREPRLVEAWRGVIDMQARAGLLDDALKARYHRDALKAPQDALAWYKSGLAASYVPPGEPIPAEALRRVDRAVRLDPSVPQFHQTRGFLLEEAGRRRGDRQLTLEALAAYERALALLDPALRPRDHAALLLNLGNASMELRSHSRAADYYRQRLATGEPFEDPVTEFLFQRSRGIASFRAAQPREAAEAFQEADFLLDVLINYDLLVGEAAEERRTELADRRALALMDAGDHRAAAELFAEVAGRRDPESLSRARALRSRGFALLREARATSGPASIAARSQARESLAQALALVEDPALRDDRQRERTGGLLQFNIAVAAGTEPGSLTDIDPAAERRLLQTALARIAIEEGDNERALEALEAELSVPRPRGAAARGYHATVRLVALDTLAAERWRAGEHARAVDALMEAVEESRLLDGDSELVNAGGLSTVLLRLAEFVLADESVAPSPDRWRASWLASATNARRRDAAARLALPDDALAAMHACLESLLARPIHLSANPVLSRADDRARVELACALLAERLSTRAGDGDPVDALQAAAWATRAGRHAANVQALALGAPRGGEAKRLAVLSHGVSIRAAARHLGTEPAAVATRAATAFAIGQGHERLAWWLEAQAALHAPGAGRVAAAARALEALERTPPGFLLDGPEAPSWEIIAALEDLHVGEATARADWREAWHRASRWTTARLRVATDQATPPALAGNEDDAAWLAEALRRRADASRALASLRQLPASADSASARSALTIATDRWRAHLAAGRDAGLPSALFLDPRAADLETSLELVTGLLLPRPAALVLVARGDAVAFTAEGPLPIAGTEAWGQLPARASIWFLLGDEPHVAPEGVDIIRLAHFDATYGALAMPVLGGLAQEQRVDASSLGTETIGEGLAAAGAITLDAAINARGADPFAWRIDGTPHTVGEVLSAARAARAWELPASVPAPARLALASAAARHGAASISFAGDDWIGVLFPAGEMRDIAAVELDSASNAAADAWLDDETLLALGPATRAWRLANLLEAPIETRLDSGFFLAQVLHDLSRAGEAADITGEALALAREHGEEEDVARALALRASFSSDAMRADDAIAAYDELATLRPARRGEFLSLAAVALENAGRHAEALDRLEQSIPLAADASARARDLLRRGRILLLHENDYGAARASFEDAAMIARENGLESMELRAALDLARVDERIGSHEAAAQRARSVRLAAQERDDPSLAAEASLVLASIEWTRGNYFDALAARQQCADDAAAAGDALVVMQSLNQLGLIRWSLNDLDAAREAFDEALALASDPLLRRDRASVMNNRGLVERSAGRLPRALADFRAALAMDTEQANQWGRAHALRNIGITLTLNGQAPQAIEALDEAVAIATTIGDRTSRAKALLALADARAAASVPDARAAFDDALAEARALPLPEVEWRALHGLARLALKDGDRAAARPLLEQSIEAIEGLRARIRVQDFQDGFLLDKLEVYDDLVRLLLDSGEPEAALHASERSRGRNFLDLLGNDRVTLANAQDQADVRRAHELRADAEMLQRELSRATTQDERAVLNQRLDAARLAHQQHLLELRARSPQVASMVSVEVATAPELQALLEPGAALVVYHVLPDELVAFVLGTGTFASARVPVGREELARAIGALREDMQTFDVIGPSREDLSRWLLDPVEPLLPPGTTVIGIAPHRELHRAPFAALRLGGVDLVERAALFQVPSASVLRHTLARRRDATAAPRVMALGNPDLSLPMAQKEAERIAWQFPGAEVYTGPDATDARLVADASDYSIVHIASHGEYDAAAPLLSRLVLAPGAGSDGSLTAQDVFGLELDADLVALSACQTGLGRLSNGDDVIGLNMAFMYAGARQVLSTLWRVDDVSTAILVKHFYRNEGEASRAEALRRAQLEVRERYPHPAHWAGMYLVGDWE